MAENIKQWLEDLALGKYADVFVENEVRLGDLQHLTEEDLKELGLPLGPRRRLMAAAAASGSKVTAPAETETKQPTGQHHDAERRLLTVLFCDLVGSTALSGRLDPEDMRDLMQRYQTAVAGAIGRQEGYVANYLGDGVVAYFGWPNAHEDQAAQAVRAGLTAVAEVGKITIPGLNGDDLSARVGIATGQVVVGDLIDESSAQQAAVSGETPNLAARLQNMAEPDNVVIDVITRQLLGASFHLEDLGRHALKGVAESTPVWRVLGEQLSDSRFETRSTELTSFIGRNHEVGLLLDRWQQAKAGEGQVVLISGEPGIGKSRMVQDFRDKIETDAHIRLRYQCSPYHLNSALYPVIRQLERAAGFKDDDSSDARLEKLEAVLQQASPNTSETAPLFAALLSLPYEDRYGALDDSPQLRRTATLRALSQQLIDLAANAPILFIFEDAHWVDPTTQELINGVVPRIVDRPILFLITHRPEWTCPFQGQSHVATLNLTRLSRGQVAEMVRELAGQHLSNDAVARIVERTEGVPLFIEELTKSLIETGFEIKEAELPATLQASLMARLDRLGDAKEVAQIGAVIGREFNYGLLAAITDKSTADLDAALDRLAQSQLVFRGGASTRGSYTFKHALIQDVAYDSLLRQRRRELHSAIAKSLEAGGDHESASSEVIARHHEEGGNIESAIRCWERAGDEALSRSAQPEAMAHFLSALRLLAVLERYSDHGRVELSLLLRLGQAQFGALGGAAPDTMATFERAVVLAREHGDQADQCRAHYGQWIGFLISGGTLKALAVADEIVGRANDEGSLWMQTFGKRLAASPLYLMGRLHEARESFEDVISTGHDFDELPKGFAHDPLYSAISNLPHVMWSLGYPETALTASQSNIERILQESRDPNTLSFALVWDMILGLFCRSAQRTKQTVDHLQEHTERTGGRFWQQMARVGSGSVDILNDNPEAGLPILRDGLEGFMSTGALQHVPFFKLLEVEGSYREGELAAALSVLHEAHEIMRRTEQRFYEPEVHRWQGKIQNAMGRPDEAETAFRTAIAVAENQCSRSWQLRATTSLREFYVETGRNAEGHDTLQRIYDTFDDGHDLPDLVEARNLLDRFS